MVMTFRSRVLLFVALLTVHAYAMQEGYPMLFMPQQGAELATEVPAIQLSSISRVSPGADIP